MSDTDKTFIMGVVFGCVGFGFWVLLGFTINTERQASNTISAEQLCNDNLKSEVNSLHFENNKIVILCEKVKN